MSPLSHSLFRKVAATTSLVAVSSLAHAAKTQPELQQSPADLLAGLQQGVAYSGFRHGQHPDRGDGANFPSDAEIKEDLQILQNAGFELIRLYDSQQNSADVLRIIEQEKLPIKVMLGIWLKAEVSNHQGCPWLNEPIPDATLEQNRKDNLAEIEQGIRLANEFPKIVVAVNVGNEALVSWNDHMVTLDSMIDHLNSVRSRIQQPVTTADNFKVYFTYGSQLADHLDFLAVHTYPAWEEKTIDQALPYSIENLLEVRAAIPDKPIVIAEAGWASLASEFGPRASEANQARHYAELSHFAKSHHITLLWFEAFDEDWKGDPNNPLGAEKHWGLFNLDRTPKQAALPLIK